MNLSLFSNKRVYVVLKNEWTYEGEVLEAGEDSILILDKKGETVFLSSDAIKTIREVIKYS